ncbi:substrate-binding domain-containing protein [Paeniglutamicibacter psychrophenolicus]|uniref:DNA-binding LacI/PurR family transcriptional regulator n=1 Tax=Paeniglutamicibacter psychrophenolicus TaxID=257454 RepID=A0ABS4WJN2_9MICC|nr:LacI family DNA-binding transcriptional regulator [Paeniglutamicibacter psychrophenolicus]MBP2376410.1 DNA-binding LacI/PurR family transcriptional regulator [Paeniglutamicibacter psychrophenolicus]
MASIKDVALRAGVSVATVSRALSGKGKVSAASREAVARAAKELGYVLSYNASSLASGRSRNIGIVVPTISRWYFANVLQGATQELNERGYDLTLYNTSGEQRHRDAVFQDLLMRQRLDAVITVTLKLTAPELHQLRAIGKPLVALGGLLPEVSTIRVDDFNIASLATEHLVSLGHTKIAFLGGADVFNVDFNLPAARLDGFEYALDQAEITVNPQWLLDADFTTAGAYQKVRSLLSNPRGRPTALLCASDEMAFGAIMAARDLGLSLPGDFSVIGIDGHELGELYGLTTIAQHPGAQGEAAVARIMELLGEDGYRDPPIPAPDQFFPTEFVLRTSTAPPAAG